MKRILQVSCQKPGSTGSGIFLLAIQEAAAKKRYQQAVIAGVSQNETDAYRKCLGDAAFYPVQFDSELLPFPVVGMSDVMPYPSTRYRDMTDEMMDQWSRAFQATLRKAVDAFRPDLILAHHLWLLSALTKRTVQGIPVFGICHGTCLRQLKLAERFASLAKEGCRELDGIFALNIFQKEQIMDSYGIEEERIVVTGAGYHRHIFYPPPEKAPGPTVKLVYAGKLSYSKGVSSLIRVYGKLVEKGLSLELHLVGSGTGEVEKRMREMAASAGGKIVFHGPVPQEYLGDIFRSMDMLVLPSFYEGMPLVVIEALASDLRVVTTDLPGVKEYLGWAVQHSGLITYVELPRCEQVDVPLAEDLPGFEERLEAAVQEQISRIPHTLAWQRTDVKQGIAALTWEGVFHSMEDVYLNILSSNNKR